MHRRRFLVLGSAALLPAVAGCSGDDFDPVESRRRLGAAAPITIDVNPERDYEYDADRDEVTTDSGTTMPFDEWGTRRATVHAADAVNEILDEASLLGEGISTGTGRADLDSLDEWAGDGRPAETEFERDLEVAPIVFHQHHYDRKGSLISKPEVSFDRIVEETPRSAEVTVRFPEKAYRAVLPVVCRRLWIRNE